MSERHEKWVKVDPGTVIPAGQPYRVERRNDCAERASEYAGAGADFTPHQQAAEWFVDSSWKPPLDLPTEPTWGIALCRDWHMGVSSDGWILDQWRFKCGYLSGHETSSEYDADAGDVLNFIPLTKEQVARIEAAR